MNQLVCDIYKSTKKEGYYLFVGKKEGLGLVPQALLDLLGDTCLVMTLILTPDKKLAQAKSKDIIEHIQETGFYLQITKNEDATMTAINRHNHKLFGQS